MKTGHSKGRAPEPVRVTPPATPNDPNPPEEGPRADLPGEGTGTPILHPLPPSSGASGAKKG